MKITRTQEGVGFQLTQEMIDGGPLPEEYFGKGAWLQGDGASVRRDRGPFTISGFITFVNGLTVELRVVGTWLVSCDGEVWRAYTPAEFKEMKFEKGEEDEK